MSIATLQKHYLRILRLWPRDPLRNVTFQAALSKRLEAPFPTLSSSSSPQGTVPENAAQAVPASGAVKALDEGRALGEANALYSLLENRYSKQYPCSDNLLRPAFNPTYYEDLLTEMDAAPNRSWLQRKWLRWSNLVRFS